MGIKTTSALFRIISISIWILMFAVSYQYNLKMETRSERVAAFNGARAMFRHIVLARSWNSAHGGVYVPVTDKIQPNPFLEDPLRDLVTTNHIHLTKINPAFMTRLISEIAAKEDHIRLHITSLVPINPANKPLPWERVYLKKFLTEEKKEGGSFHREGGKRNFRYMAPLRLTRDCVRCHGKQGYQIGEIRGGISLTLPFPEKERNLVMLWTHIIAALTGGAGLFWFGAYMGKSGRQLIRAKDAAIESSVTKGQFLANMSHEIRTPMNGVIGMTELLMETDLTDEQKGYVLAISRSGDALIYLVNDILDYSKIEAGKIQLETIGFDLLTLVEDVCELMSVDAHKKGLDIAGLVYNDVPQNLMGDPKRLRQVCVNLLGNAVKFTAMGEVSLVVSLVEESPKKVTLHFCVKDTGSGIVKEDVDKIFESYVQADSSTTRRFGGTGLGLSISHEFIRLMGGEIGVDSSPGKGSEFWFTLGFEKQPALALVEKVPVIQPDIRLLIVDDNQMNQFVFSEYLRTLDHCRLDFISQPQKVLIALQQAHGAGRAYDIVILTAEMDGGVNLGRKIKACTNLNLTRLILLASGGKRGDADRMQEIGFQAYLTAPIKKNVLIGSILSVMEQTPGRPIITRHSINENQGKSSHGKLSLNILLAEDNKLNQKVLVKMLEKMGHFTRVVENGKDAVRLFKKHRFDIIFMDGQMPEMDGIEAVGHIRSIEKQLEKEAAVPVVAITANAMTGDREKFLNAGMNDYITKPVKRQNIVDVLEKLCPGI